ncbi:SDR family oxidoreductase [Flavobacteriaceae bacterium]|jgi:3-oxoacyl-[acyl-carrier protein] reductase|nr:SDR family oxidoreductase [Cryomorphaceae bacterium]MDA9160695.1 SDR family oxidoreductase [Flavobacteriaceae bacterium]MBT7739002.1 SDR family oxidoreductase [Cryomorphaceae bacterium]MDA9203881.1 SDR family oxidoreductase [Flavobacteriaceae bacterium]MDA9818695.1 SDR family oxidoreductase [Flavobacteriaceae bacterium]
MKIDLAGKKALIGGSSKGIGLGIASQLAESGASVCLMARNKSKLEEIINQLPNSENHSYLIVDFSNFEEYKIKIEAYLENNQVDILVNNTQGPPAGNSLSKDIDSYQEAFDLLFKSIVYTTSLIVPKMQKNKWGRIINVTSVSVKEPLNYLVLSNSIRSAVVAWAKSLSVDVGKDGVTVNSILTGYFDTERIKELNKEKSKSLNISEEEVLEKMKSLVPINRLGKTEEYGYLVSFLSSDKASYINGASIPIDGGLLRSY